MELHKEAADRIEELKQQLKSSVEEAYDNGVRAVQDEANRSINELEAQRSAIAATDESDRYRAQKRITELEAQLAKKINDIESKVDRVEDVLCDFKACNYASEQGNLVRDRFVAMIQAAIKGEGR